MTGNTPSPILTQEQFELRRKLESIFMPYAHRQRNNAYEKNTKAGDAPELASLRFVHYTSAEAALNIIRTKRIWMRNAVCMADYREECSMALTFSVDSSPDSSKRDRFVTALDASVQGAVSDAITAFDQQWNSIRLGYIRHVCVLSTNRMRTCTVASPCGGDSEAAQSGLRWFLEFHGFQELRMS